MCYIHYQSTLNERKCHNVDVITERQRGIWWTSPKENIKNVFQYRMHLETFWSPSETIFASELIDIWMWMVKKRWEVLRVKCSTKDNRCCEENASLVLWFRRLTLTTSKKSHHSLPIDVIRQVYLSNIRYSWRYTSQSFQPRYVEGIAQRPFSFNINWRNLFDTGVVYKNKYAC